MVVFEPIRGLRLSVWEPVLRSSRYATNKASSGQSKDPWFWLARKPTIEGPHPDRYKTSTKDCLVSPSTPKALHHKPRSTYASSHTRSTSKPSHTSPTLSTPDTNATSRDQNDNFEDDDEDTILLGEDEDVKKNDNQFDFLLNWWWRHQFTSVEKKPEVHPVELPVHQGKILDQKRPITVKNWSRKYFCFIC